MSRAAAPAARLTDPPVLCSTLHSPDLGSRCDLLSLLLLTGQGMLPGPALRALRPAPTSPSRPPRTSLAPGEMCAGQQSPPTLARRARPSRPRAASPPARRPPRAQHGNREQQGQPLRQGHRGSLTSPVQEVAPQPSPLVLPLKAKLACPLLWAAPFDALRRGDTSAPRVGVLQALPPPRHTPWFLLCHLQDSTARQALALGRLPRATCCHPTGPVRAPSLPAQTRGPGGQGTHRRSAACEAWRLSSSTSHPAQVLCSHHAGEDGRAGHGLAAKRAQLMSPARAHAARRPDAARSAGRMGGKEALKLASA